MPRGAGQVRGFRGEQAMGLMYSMPDDVVRRNLLLVLPVDVLVGIRSASLPVTSCVVVSPGFKLSGSAVAIGMLSRRNAIASKPFAGTGSIYMSYIHGWDTCQSKSKEESCSMQF